MFSDTSWESLERLMSAVPICKLVHHAHRHLQVADPCLSQNISPVPALYAAEDEDKQEAVGLVASRAANNNPGGGGGLRTQGKVAVAKGHQANEKDVCDCEHCHQHQHQEVLPLAFPAGPGKKRRKESYE